MAGEVKVRWHPQYKPSANKFAKQYAADNPRFDRAKFLKACGVK